MRPFIPTTALAIAAISFGLSIAVAQPAAAPVQAPFAVPPFKNLKVLPQDTSRADLLNTMKSFSQSLGVRCTHCHVGVEGQPLTTFDFASDAKQKKETARAMLRLVHKLNTQDLDAIPGLLDAQVTCYTCHRGATKPLTAAPAAPSTPAPPPKPANSERG